MRFVVLRRLALIGAGVTALVGSVPSAQAAPVTTVNVAAGISPSAAARSSSLWALEDPVLANGCELRARGGDG